MVLVRAFDGRETEPQLTSRRAVLGLSRREARLVAGESLSVQLFPGELRTSTLIRHEELRELKVQCLILFPDQLVVRGSRLVEPRGGQTSRKVDARPEIRPRGLEQILVPLPQVEARFGHGGEAESQ